MNYERIYNQIIESTKSENRVKGSSIYYEKHHIIPRCIGGNNDKENLVLLTAREHFICHKLLCEIYPDNKKLVFALWRMYGIKNTSRVDSYKISSREYERIRKLFSLHIGPILSQSNKGIPKSETMKRKVSLINMGRKASDDTRKKQSNSQKGKIMSLETRQKIGAFNKGKIVSAETRAKLSKANKGKITSEETRQKLRDHNLGKKHTPETILKMKDSHQKKSNHE